MTNLFDVQLIYLTVSEGLDKSLLTSLGSETDSDGEDDDCGLNFDQGGDHEDFYEQLVGNL